MSDFWQTIGPGRMFQALEDVPCYSEYWLGQTKILSKGTIVVELGSWNPKYPGDSARKFKSPDGSLGFASGFDPSYPPLKFKLLGPVDRKILG